MEYLNKMDWELLWSILKDTILPHSGRLILSIILFAILGFILSILFVILLHKKGIFKRIPKYYKWTVKLYFPLLIVAFVYIFGQIGFIRGVHSILEKEQETIVAGIYAKTLNAAFGSEESKDDFITGLQALAIGAKEDSNKIVEQLKQKTQAYNSGNTIIDASKNKVSNYLIDKYGNEIYKISLYAMINMAAGRAAAHTNINEVLPYEEFSAAVDFLLEVGYKDIEVVIKNQLVEWFNLLINNQYKSMLNGMFILVLIIMSIPLIEFFIYKKWIEPKYLEKEDEVEKEIEKQS